MNNLDNLLDSKIDKLLLDTHVLIWYLEGIKLSDDQVKEIEKARNNNGLYISLTTAAQAWATGYYQQQLINFTIGNLNASVDPEASNT